RPLERPGTSLGSSGVVRLLPRPPRALRTSTIAAPERSQMHVAVLGGGLQGCSTALALAERGVRVTLFDRNSQLLHGAALANEGKIHLGYMYAGDPSLNTA